MEHHTVDCGRFFMSKRIKQRKIGDLVIHLLISSTVGFTFMLLFVFLGTWFILKGTVGERGIELILLLSVFMGTALSSLLSRGHVNGAIPHMLLSSGSFLTLLLVAALVYKGGMFSFLNWKTIAAALCGSAFGIVTN